MNMQALRTTAALVLAIGVAAPQLAAQQQAEPEQQAATRQKAEAEAPEPRQIEVTILGMSCPFCAYGVQQKLNKLEGVSELEVVLKTGIATLTLEEGADLSNDILKQTVKDAGFEAAMISRNFKSEFPSFMQMAKD